MIGLPPKSKRAMSRFLMSLFPKPKREVARVPIPPSPPRPEPAPASVTEGRNRSLRGKAREAALTLRRWERSQEGSGLRALVGAYEDRRNAERNRCRRAHCWIELSKVWMKADGSHNRASEEGMTRVDNTQGGLALDRDGLFFWKNQGRLQRVALDEVWSWQVPPESLDGLVLAKIDLEEVSQQLHRVAGSLHPHRHMTTWWRD